MPSRSTPISSWPWRQAVEHHDLIVEKCTLLAELKASNAKLLEANRLEGAFIEVVSHELNTPLTVVLGMLDLWRISQGSTASPIERQWVNPLEPPRFGWRRTVERMLKLMRTRDFSQSLDTQSIELRPIVDRVIDELSPYLELRRQNVTVDVDPLVGPFEADPTKIADILINLLANAIKFTPDGGTIGVPASNRDRSTSSVSRSAIGAGVAPGDQQHLFEPFFTGFDTTSPLVRRTTSTASEASDWASAWSRLSCSSRRPRRGFKHRRPGRHVRLRPTAIAVQPRARVNARNSRQRRPAG